MPQEHVRKLYLESIIRMCVIKLTSCALFVLFMISRFSANYQIYYFNYAGMCQERFFTTDSNYSNYGVKIRGSSLTLGLYLYQSKTLQSNAYFFISLNTTLMLIIFALFQMMRPTNLNWSQNSMLSFIHKLKIHIAIFQKSGFYSHHFLLV